MNKVRLIGAAKMVLGTLVTIGLYLLLSKIGSLELSSVRRGIAGLIALPAVFALIGMSEAIRGTPFVQLAAKWDSSSLSKRWNLSLLVILMVVAIIIIVFASMLSEL